MLNTNFYLNIDLVSKFSPNNSNFLSSVNQTKFNLHVVSGKNLPIYNSSLNTTSSNLFSSSLPSKVDFSENMSYRNYILTTYPNSETLLLESSLLKLANFRLSELNTFSSSHENTNINFLRKERLYTKLKYSRSPAYDIVSGGAAAILAGFLGFLISEKYGFELVDSGDFYFLFMYIVFFSFSIRPLLTSISSNSPISTIFSLKPVISYYLTLLYFLGRK